MGFYLLRSDTVPRGHRSIKARKDAISFVITVETFILCQTIHRGAITAGENRSGISVDLGSLYSGTHCKHLAQMARVIGGQEGLSCGSNFWSVH